jgi:phage terminase large subunit-like protein
MSVRGAPPQVWAERAALLARSLKAEAIIAEGNMGGELVRTMLKLVAGDCPVRLVSARVSKHGRAAPIAALYARGRVSHYGVFAALEDEMCGFGAPGFAGGDDRLDALVWALSELLLNDARPRMRVI